MLNEKNVKSQVIHRLQCALETYDLVLLVQESVWVTERMRSLSDLEAKRLSSFHGKVLLLSTNVLEFDTKLLGFESQVILQEEIRSLFYLYEFSNRFRIISKDGMYGNIFNLVDNGLLTYMEALEAILR